VATPWKNGGGITHEAMRVPPGGETFLWRVSVAHIDTSGPFSDFAGYNRTMVLLRGAGIELRFGDGTGKTLRQPGDLVNFDGAQPTHGELLDGPCVDLNLMISKKDSAAARIERFIESFALSTARNETTLLFPIERRIKLQMSSGKAATLEAGDLAVLSQGGARISRLESSGGSLATPVFVATLKLMGGQ
jgi:uncharacterized protein